MSDAEDPADSCLTWEEWLSRPRPIVEQPRGSENGELFLPAEE